MPSWKTITATVTVILKYPSLSMFVFESRILFNLLKMRRLYLAAYFSKNLFRRTVYRTGFLGRAEVPGPFFAYGPWSSLVSCWLHAQIARSRPAAGRSDVHRRDSVWGTHPSFFGFGGGCAFDPVISAGRRQRL